MKIMMPTLVALLVVASPLAAQDVRVDLNPELTSISFRLQATLHSVHGSAAAVSGWFEINIDSGSAVGHATIDATTAGTGNKKRDKKMHTKVLRTDDYSRIVFRADHFEGDLALSGASDVVLHGKIEILGEPHEIGIPLDIIINDGQFTASGTFEIPYVEWGIKDPSTFILRVAKVVEVNIEAEGTIAVVDQ
jgi:polyisoprenoid-binding protein YceI